MATPLQTPTGQKAQSQKKSISEFLGVDVYSAGGGFLEDMAEAAEMRRTAKEQVQSPRAFQLSSDNVLIQ